MSMRISGLRLTLRLIQDTTRLTSSEKLVLMVIAVNSTEQGLCLRMDSDLIAQCASLSERLVSKVIQDLEREGYIIALKCIKRNSNYVQISLTPKLSADYKALKAEVANLEAIPAH